MIKILTTVLMMCLVTLFVNGQTIKVTGGVNLMGLKTAFETPTDVIPSDGDLPVKATRLKNENVNSTLLLASIKDMSNETGFYFGLALSDVSLSETLELLPEVRFVTVKDFSQIQVPVVLKHHIVTNLSAVAGPNFSFLLDPSQNTKAFNFSLNFGLSYNLSDKFSMEGRYDWGQTNLLKNGNSNNYIKMNNIQFGIAYNFRN